MFLDLGALYEKGHDAALDAVTAGKTGPGYGLEDVAPEGDWPAIISSGMAWLVISGTIDGTLKAMRASGATAADVLDYPNNPNLTALVTPQDVNIARAWLAGALTQNLDEDAINLAVRNTLSKFSWDRDAARITSLMLAVVSIGGHATDNQR